MPLRQSSDPLCALSRICAAFIKLGWVIEQTAHLHPYLARTWNRNRCWLGRTFVVPLRVAAPPTSSNGLSDPDAGAYSGLFCPNRIRNCLLSSSKSTTHPNRTE